MIFAIWMVPVYDRLHSVVPGIFNSRMYAVFQMLRTFAIVVVGYGIFKPANISSTMHIFGSCSEISSVGLISLRLFVRDAYPLWCAVGFLFAVDVIHYKKGNGWIRSLMAKCPLLLQLALICIGLIYIVNFGTYGDGYNHFEYFKF
jgi:hypothetical protein